MIKSAFFLFFANNVNFSFNVISLLMDSLQFKHSIHYKGKIYLQQQTANELYISFFNVISTRKGDYFVQKLVH